MVSARALDINLGLDSGLQLTSWVAAGKSFYSSLCTSRVSSVQWVKNTHFGTIGTVEVANVDRIKGIQDMVDTVKMP